MLAGWTGRCAGPGAVKSITANTGANTVTVTLTKPYNALLTSFSVPFATPVICPAGLKNPKGLSAAGEDPAHKTTGEDDERHEAHAKQGELVQELERIGT